MSAHRKCGLKPFRSETSIRRTGEGGQGKAGRGRRGGGGGGEGPLF